MTSTLDQALKDAAALLAQADFLMVAAGAGMGVDSGLPDFRGDDGFWRAYPALRQGGLDFSSMASPEAFRAMPERAWGFYGHRLALYRRTMPHPGFAILKHWGERMPKGYGVFTSNVDGQFQKAGFGEALIEECHGSIHHMQCTSPCTDEIWSADLFEPQTDDAQCLLTGPYPVCPNCGALARPNILMFGDGGWIPARGDAQASSLARRLAQAQRPLVIEIGAGTAIPSVRRFSEMVARRDGGRLLRINLREPAVPGSDNVGLPCGGLEALLAIEQCGAQFSIGR
ncbi:MAG: Sir2 family NAD-dependent protein deacetylase [Pseudomonadota bacterium]